MSRDRAQKKSLLFTGKRIMAQDKEVDSQPRLRAKKGVAGAKD